MNRQEIFNQVYFGLKSQGFVRSVKPRASGVVKCCYRGDEGRKCAVGFLIPDEKYQESVEKMNPDDLIENKIIHLESLSDLPFLRELQSIHDNAFDPEDMKLNLESYAQELHLTIPEESQ